MRERERERGGEREREREREQWRNRRGAGGQSAPHRLSTGKFFEKNEARRKGYKNGKLRGKYEKKWENEG